MGTKCEIGDIALCARGYLGLITHIEVSGVNDSLYCGVRIYGERFGDLWQSKSPDYVAQLHDLLDCAGITEE